MGSAKKKKKNLFRKISSFSRKSDFVTIVEEAKVET